MVLKEWTSQHWMHYVNYCQIDFRQTFVMSELGIVRVSKSRNSLFMKIGGEVETRG